MRKASFYLIFILAITSFSCKERSCNDMTREFGSHEEIREYIRSRSYKIKDSIKVLNSRLMVSANFYSCDGLTGHFSFTRESGSEFFSSGIPITKWAEFKKSPSKEDYYYDTISKISKPEFTIVSTIILDSTGRVIK